MRNNWLLWVTSLVLAGGCAKLGNRPDDASGGGMTKPFEPYVIEDSAKIVSYSNGLRMYTVKHGPGDYPSEGMNVRMNYYGTLVDGTVFDNSFGREEPFKFTLGSTSLIPGIEDAVRKLRFGSKAVVIVPPELGYGEKNLPPNIPPNSTLIFHLDLLGSF